MGYEFAYEMLFATLREVEKDLLLIREELRHIDDLVQAAKTKARISYMKAEEVRGPAPVKPPIESLNPPGY